MKKKLTFKTKINIQLIRKCNKQEILNILEIKNLNHSVFCRSQTPFRLRYIFQKANIKITEIKNYVAWTILKKLDPLIEKFFAFIFLLVFNYLRNLKDFFFPKCIEI